MPWLTPDDSPPLVQRAIFIPDGVHYFAVLIGLLWELAEPENWEKYGILEPEEVAEVWRAALELFDP